MRVSDCLSGFRTWLFRALFGLMLISASVQALELSFAESQTQLDLSRQSIQQIQEQLSSPLTVDDVDLASLRNELIATHERMQILALSLEPELNAVQARLNELGKQDEEVAETDALRVQRQQLLGTQSQLDGQLKQAKLLAIEAIQLQDQVIQRRRFLFQQQLGMRTQPLVSVGFWETVQRDVPTDWQKLSAVFQEIKASFKEVSKWAWLVALGAAVVLVGGLVFIAMRLPFFAITHTKPSRLRRSFHAVGLIAVYTLIPGVLFTIVDQLLRSNVGLSDQLSKMMAQLVWAAYLAGFVSGLGRVLLAPNRPSWRLPPIPSKLAERLSPLPYILAFLLALGWLSQQVLSLINASLSTTLLLNSINILCLNALIGFVAWTLGRSVQRSRRIDADPGAEWLPPWFMTVPIVLMMAVTSSLLAFFLGYNALSGVIVQEVLWLVLVVGSAYVVLALLTDIGDSLMLWVRERSQEYHWPVSQFRTRSQITLLLTGAVRVWVVVMAATLVFLPFGEHPGDWVHKRLGFLLEGFNVGQLYIKPSALLSALSVLLLGVLVVRLLQKWLMERFLPVTSLDPGMRGSTANLFSYVAYFFVFAAVLSSLGIGLDRMAWIISALSVGIGFGLQAVVQNFVSGLILLAERPIKVGDWVSVNGVDGNVRKINARATEIEMFDRSTLIVPNSEFITKSVRNVTLSNPLGLVKIQLTLPISTDAKKVREIMLTAMSEQAEVLEQPAPAVSLDGFDANSGLVFGASCYVASPRQVSNVRSAILFETLDRFRQQELALHHTQVMSLQATESTLKSAVVTEEEHEKKYAK